MLRPFTIAAWFAVAGYLTVLAGWVLVQQLVGDTTPTLFMINAVGIYLFVPLPLALLVALAHRSLPLIVGSLAAVVVFAWFWGGLFWPNSEEKPEGTVLTVMAYNVLGFNMDGEGVVDALRKSDADIIGLSELNRQVARAIARDLREEYPYQTLDPQDGVTGSGVISRLPFEAVSVPDLHDVGWISPPTVVELQFEGQQVLFVRVHSASGARHFEARERQAHLLSEFASTAQQPVIIAGDFNTTDRNDSYEILTEHLYDAWEKVGSGLGNTFPGASKEVTPGSSRPDMWGIDVPQWLIRIDYVFCTYDWEPVDARIGPWDGGSDHRPVIAEVALRSQSQPYAGP
ncbi:MAG TPA: endonuclease/exonuclease/phosphatase family protein [Dehalococcoidia bacterium]|nr:endonuclease/exonuclease/phosphatase family protein [Dehalococcoidia bacterium]